MSSNLDTPGASPRATAADWPWVEARSTTPGSMARRVFGLPAEIWRHRELAIAGARRELAARLSGTLLGRAWPLVQPLVLFAVYHALFARIFGMGFGREAGATTAAYLFVGVVVWTAFAEGVGRATLAFTDRGELIKRVHFPAELLVLQTLAAQWVLMAMALAGFVGIAPLLDAQLRPGATLALLPLAFLLQGIFASGLALATASLHALLRDTQHFVSVFLTLWMFATPVFWIPSPRLLPGVEPFLPWLEWNPMHAFVSLWRRVLVDGLPAEAFTQPLGTLVAQTAAWSAAAWIVGALLFASVERRLPDEV